MRARATVYGAGNPVALGSGIHCSIEGRYADSLDSMRTLVISTMMSKMISPAVLSRDLLQVYSL